MQKELYFLRSFEQNITTDLLTLFEPSITEDSRLHVYDRFYGLSHKDVGVYVMVDNQVAGGVWARVYKESDKTAGYVNETTPELIISVKPEYQRQGLSKDLLPQILNELTRIHDSVSVSVPADSYIEQLFLRYGFVPYSDTLTFSELLKTDTITLIKEIDKVEEVFTGYPLVTKDAFY